MLQQILQKIQTAKEPVNLNELANELGVERSALDGMIQFWVRKGRLKENDFYSETPDACHTIACSSGTCAGPKDCAFIMTTPRTYSLTLHDPK